MKKHAILFPVSFLVYIVLYFESPYITARLQADIVVQLAGIVFIYQIAYLIFFRKTLQVSFRRALASFFLWLSIIAEIIVLYNYIDAFINGYRWCFLTFHSDPYYGFDAWAHMGFESIVYIPLLAISIIYQLIYFIVVHIKKKKRG